MSCEETWSMNTRSELRMRSISLRRICEACARTRWNTAWIRWPQMLQEPRSKTLKQRMWPKCLSISSATARRKRKNARERSKKFKWTSDLLVLESLQPMSSREYLMSSKVGKLTVRMAFRIWVSHSLRTVARDSIMAMLTTLTISIALSMCSRDLESTSLHE